MTGRAPIACSVFFRRAPCSCRGLLGRCSHRSWGAQDVPAAYWNVAEPQEVTRIHQQYADAGAQILLTNTFQATAPALKRDHIESSVNLVCAEAVAAAHAAGGQNLVGSIGPCGIEWFHKDEPEYRLARDAYREQAHVLLAAGVQACMLETFTSIRDLEPAVAGVADVADGMPMFISFAVDDEGNLLGDGLNVEAACIWAEKHGATAVGVNCCSIAAATLCVPRMASSSRGYIMVRPYASLPVRDDEAASGGAKMPRPSPPLPCDGRPMALASSARAVGPRLHRHVLSPRSLTHVIGLSKSDYSGDRCMCGAHGLCGPY